MKRKVINNPHDVGFKELETYEGESIENKISRIVENNEPISDGAPLVYTKRGDGVRAEYNIRTDKWDLAVEKMSKVSQAKRNRIKENMVKGVEQKKESEEKTE